MVKLSDYLNYLYMEVIQARKQADKLAIQTAKEYAKDDYLKYFKAPRYTMPSVKLEIPVKITEIDNRVKYDFNMDNDAFLQDVNSRIEKVNEAKNLNLNPLTQNDLDNKAFKQAVAQLEKSDQKYVRGKGVDLNKINLHDVSSVIHKKVGFIKADTSTEDNLLVLNNIIRTAFLERYTPVSADLRNIFIDPNTTKEEDKEKIMVKLNIELVDEGIQIKSGKDKNGNPIEEIIID